MITNTDRTFSDNPSFLLDEGDFESGQDSTILVRERSRGTKLEGAYQKRKGVLIEQSNHTIIFLRAGRSQSTIISKRDIGNMDQQPCCSKWLVNTANKKPPKLPKTNKVAENEEPPIINEIPLQQSTPTPVETPTTNQQPRNKKNATHALLALKQKVKEQKAKKATHKRRKERKTNKQRKTGTNYRRIRFRGGNTNPTRTDSRGGNRRKQKQRHKRQNRTKGETADKRSNRKKRRGHRSRAKRDYYGNNVMVTQLSPATEQEEN